MHALLFVANGAIWFWALIAFAPRHSLLLGAALLASTFSLGHAVDADHISAIDK